ncbi:hypothetical protein [Aquimarina sediminis]|uniref:hypothetical protein n=1 Tax=Aquimarina sediminis TaxID=2070536 RepID=UPI000CA05B1E|nr:hypothetical protein [Aquimarina sediminis]
MKIVKLLLILFSPLSLIGQPTGEENYTKVKLIFSNCSKDTLFFKKLSSDKFVSKKGDYQLSFKTVSIEDNEVVDITENTWFLKDHLFIVKYVSSLDLVPKDNIPDKKWNLKIKMYKKKKEMTVTLKLYQEENIILSIPFKKGNYEVTDPENPILIKVKG